MNIRFGFMVWVPGLLMPPGEDIEAVNSAELCTCDCYSCQGKHHLCKHTHREKAVALLDSKTVWSGPYRRTRVEAIQDIEDYKRRILDSGYDGASGD